MADKNKIEFVAGFKAEEVLKGLQQIKASMSELTTNTNLFKGVDKDFARIQKLLLDIQAASRLDMSDPKNLKSYEKLLGQLDLATERVGVNLKSIASNTGAFDFPGIDEAKKKLAALESQTKDLQDSVKSAQKDFASSLRGVGLDNNAAQQIAKDAKTSEEAVAALEQEVLKMYDKLEQKKQKGKNEANFTKLVGDGNGIRGAQTVRYTTGLTTASGDKATTAQVASVNEAVNAALREGIKNGQTFDQIWVKILEDVNKVGVSFANQDEVQARLQNRYTNAERSFTGMTAEAQRYEQIIKQIGTVNEDGSITLTPQALQQATEGFKNLGAANQAYNQNQQATARAQSEVNDLQNNGAAILGKVGEQTDRVAASVRGLTEEDKKNIAEQQKVNAVTQEMQNFFDSIGNTVKNVLSLGNAWMQFRRVVSQTFQDVKRLDKAFASIAMVTDYTVSGLWENYSTYAQIAKDLGRSTEDAIQASALFFQQGRLLMFYTSGLNFLETIF